MASDHHQHQQHPHQQQMSSAGLMRYRSAPSSYFANFVDDCEGYLQSARPPSPETEKIIARFMAEDSSPQEELEEIGKSSHAQANGRQDLGPEFTASPPVIYQSSSSRPPLPTQGLKGTAAAPASEMEGSPYRAVAQTKQLEGGASNSNLVRHSSSPAGLFSHQNMENGYGITRGMGNFGNVNSSNGEASFSSASRLKGQINFSSGPPSSSGLMSQLPDMGNKSLGAGSPDDNGDGYLTGFPVGSWDDPGAFAENFSGLKRSREDDRKMFSGVNGLENQHGEPHAPNVLPRHMSLPRTSAEMATVEKYLQFQDSVPCKIRAKRGCATHPRSIAERVRRTRISERMRKLQELVPNMDKQTSTADMLDLAVDYIKDLQKQVEMLSETRARCTCSSNSKP